MSTKKPTKDPAQRADQYITISVAEYVCLVKAATLLEVVVNDQTYSREAVAAVNATIGKMQRQAGAGAAE